ncbi:hypothetical protein K474DRAFT_1623921 [Panus rudis PR-1116 ss-1]|nr:hypothetical protein K474DRAFT_1623921 [Panus rudis PR-1116 ss-1]
MVQMYSKEQVIHDRVNAVRLIRSIERDVAAANDSLNDPKQSSSRTAWLRSQRLLQAVKHARKLLNNVQDYEINDPSSSGDSYESLRMTVDRMETMVTEINKRVTPKPTRPSPVLPTIPPPKEEIQPVSAVPSMTVDVSSPLMPNDTDPSSAISTQDLLLSPSDSIPTATNEDTLERRPSLSPASSRAGLGTAATSGSTSNATPAPAFLQNSTALHDELSAQLAAMATQLKHNTLHFATSLEKDKSVLTEAQEKLERNYDVMTKERVRLRDHSSKSWGTTWITVLSIVVAIIGFILTLFVIRLT